MERNLSFDTEGLENIAVHLGWAQLEMFADEVDKVQVMAAGDDSSVEDLRIAVKDGTLLVEQPQYGLSLNIMESRWLQVCVRVPSQWKGSVALSTLSGLLSARKLSAKTLSMETVSGDLRAVRITAGDASLKTVGGDMHGEQLTAENLSVRSVSGDTALDALSVASAQMHQRQRRADLQHDLLLPQGGCDRRFRQRDHHRAGGGDGRKPALHQRPCAHRRRGHPRGRGCAQRAGSPA